MRLLRRRLIPRADERRVELVGRARVAFAALTLVAASFVGTGASADSAKSEAYFQQGRQLLTQGKIIDACASFKKSVVEEPSIGGELNLGDCYERLGRTASALEYFRAAETMAGADDVARGKEAKRRAERLEPLVARLVVRVVGAPADAKVYVDGVVASIPPTGIAVDPGEHLVQLRAADRVLFETRVSLAPQEHRDATLDASKPETGAPPNAAPTGTSSAFPQRTVGIVAAVGGAAALAVGGVLLVLADGKKTELTALCPDYPTCPVSARSDAEALNDSGRSQQTMGFVALVSGIVLVGGGAALYFTAPKPQAAGIRVTPLMVGSQGGTACGVLAAPRGFAVQGRF